jgi:hypothetical protein
MAGKLHRPRDWGGVGVWSLYFHCLSLSRADYLPAGVNTCNGGRGGSEGQTGCRLAALGGQQNGSEAIPLLRFGSLGCGWNLHCAQGVDCRRTLSVKGGQYAKHDLTGIGLVRLLAQLFARGQVVIHRLQKGRFELGDRFPVESCHVPRGGAGSNRPFSLRPRKTKIARALRRGLFR